jgi:hypothetical protein
MCCAVCRGHPGTVLVDPVEAVRHVISRSNVCRVLQRIISSHHRPVSVTSALANYSSSPSPSPHTSSPETDTETETETEGEAVKRQKKGQHGYPCPFSQPKYLIVEDISRIISMFRASGLQFPVICKPVEACGTPTSHSMVWWWWWCCWWCCWFGLVGLGWV